MDISHAVAAKIKDQELIELLDGSKPGDMIRRPVMLLFKTPPIPSSDIPPTDSRYDDFVDAVAGIAEKGEQQLSAIPGLKINNFMKSMCTANVSGTAEAIRQAIELDSVKVAALGDRQIFRPAR